jgi:hypothetical protein
MLVDKARPMAPLFTLVDGILVGHLFCNLAGDDLKGLGLSGRSVATFPASTPHFSDWSAKRLAHKPKFGYAGSVNKAEG